MPDAGLASAAASATNASKFAANSRILRKIKISMISWWCRTAARQ